MFICTDLPLQPWYIVASGWQACQAACEAYLPPQTQCATACWGAQITGRVGCRWNHAKSQPTARHQVLLRWIPRCCQCVWAAQHGKVGLNYTNELIYHILAETNPCLYKPISLCYCLCGRLLFSILTWLIDWRESVWYMEMRITDNILWEWIWMSVFLLLSGNFLFITHILYRELMLFHVMKLLFYLAHFI